MLPWGADRPGTRKMPNCTRNDQFEAHAALYYKFATVEQRDVLNLINCQLPCKYREIMRVETPMTQKMEDNGLVMFSLTLVTTDVRVETQALVYNFGTLVSNFGGTLGLFLGFSFFMLWDFVSYICIVCNASRA
jgi:hypothetical protein